MQGSEIYNLKCMHNECCLLPKDFQLIGCRGEWTGEQGAGNTAVTPSSLANGVECTPQRWLPLGHETRKNT